MWSTKYSLKFSFTVKQNPTQICLPGARQIREKSKTAPAFDYQYWQDSRIPTLHFQNSLPRLPIPKLADTCRRYLAAQRPLLDDEAYKQTEQLVQEFEAGVGRELQEQLIADDRRNKATSYISRRWFDMYLSDRTPLPINYNPMLVFQQNSEPAYNDQLIRASNLLLSALRFYKSLCEDKLEPEVFHMNPTKSDTKLFQTLCSLTPKALSWYMAYLHNVYALDMSQYHHLFNSTRIPEVGKDRIVQKFARHVLVQCKGNFYTFDVLSTSGNILQPAELYSGLKQIVAAAENEAASRYPLGILTTMNRDRWAELRSHLLSLGNADALDAIDSALFSICLDSDVIGDDKYKLIHAFLHSDGTNRWFDKSVSLQITKDGYAALNFEHSWGDGVAVLRFFNDIHKDSTEHPQIHSHALPTPADVTIKKLDFRLDDRIRQSVDAAVKDFASVCSLLDVNYVESDSLDRKFCKKHGVSPDGLMQLCFQAAYFKQHGKFVSTYESCSTAAFRHGRTETIRPLTTATKAFILAQHARNKAPISELAALIKNCSNVHWQLSKEAAMGQGFDRHLYVLRQLAGEDLAMFSDPAYLAINHNVLSTSSLSSPAILAGGFGPVVRDGYGVGYMIRGETMGTLATSYPGLNGRQYIDCLKDAMREAVDVLTSAERQ